MRNVPARVVGLVTFYADGVERQEIHVRLGKALGLPYQLGRRVPIELQIGHTTYAAGLRALTSYGVAWVCPDMALAGRKVRLVDALHGSGFRKGQNVVLQALGRKIRVLPE